MTDKYNDEILARRMLVTRRALERIAAYRIEQYGLDCTVDEYIERCKQVTREKEGRP